jgi:hypothetical protein
MGFTWNVRVFVEQPSFGGQAVLGPDLLEMDERPLPGTERQVLQAADGEGVVEFHGFVPAG